MMPVSIAPYPRFRAYYPGTSNLLVGGKLFSYQAGTTGTSYPLSTYTSASGATPNPNPVILDSNGEADVWLSGFYKLVLQDSTGNQIFVKDFVSSMPYTGSLGSQWVVQPGPFVYVSGTQFQVLGDQSSIFQVGIALQVQVTAGIIYGHVSSITVAGIPLTTTVAVNWNSGQLDSGLSAVSTGLITVQNSSLPPHAISHKSGGIDVIGLDTLGSPTDNTNLNTSLSAHGLFPKLPGGTVNYWRADGSWAAPLGDPGEGHITILPWAYNTITQGVWSLTGNAAWATYAFYNSTAAQNDQLDYRVTLATGTYTLGVLGSVYTDKGIATILIDGSSVGTIDWYGSSAVNVIKTLAGISTTVGLHTLSIKIASKNASSSGYSYYPYIMWIYRTS